MDFEASCQQLGLIPAPDGVWYGVISGHVVALFGKNFVRGHGGKVHVEGSIQAELAAPSLTIQVSHADPSPKRIEPSDVKCGSRVDPLIKSGMAQCATEPHRSLLFLFDARFIDSYDALREVVHGFLAGLDDAGVPLRGQRCHWCGLRDADDCIFIEGRATRICDECVEERSGRAKCSRTLSGAGVSVTVVAAVLAVIPSAMIAATLQVLYFALINWITGGEDEAIHVPRIVVFLLLGGYALAVAAPVALILNKIRDRGDLLAACAAFLSTLFASVLAEVLVIAWITGNVAEWLQPWFIKRVLALTWQYADFGFSVRVFLAVMASFVASVWVRPKIRPFFD